MVGSLVKRFVCVGIVWVGAMALPSPAPAQSTMSYFNTAITEVYGASTYPITGKLDLEIFPDGHLRGYYHTSFYKLFIPVAGGRDGNYIWFDIGPSSVDLGIGAGPEGKLHVVATMDSNGAFRGQVYPETAAVISGLSMQYNFNNTSPTSQNSTDQYLFAATPTSEVEPTPAP
jgi:hypothetical protein